MSLPFLCLALFYFLLSFRHGYIRPPVCGEEEKGNSALYYHLHATVITSTALKVFPVSHSMGPSPLYCYSQDQASLSRRARRSRAVSGINILVTL